MVLAIFPLWNLDIPRETEIQNCAVQYILQIYMCFVTQQHLTSSPWIQQRTKISHHISYKCTYHKYTSSTNHPWSYACVWLPHLHTGISPQASKPPVSRCVWINSIYKSAHGQFDDSRQLLICKWGNYPLAYDYDRGWLVSRVCIISLKKWIRLM